MCQFIISILNKYLQHEYTMISQLLAELTETSGKDVKIFHFKLLKY